MMRPRALGSAVSCTRPLEKSICIMNSTAITKAKPLNTSELGENDMMIARLPMMKRLMPRNRTRMGSRRQPAMSDPPMAPRAAIVLYQE